jgi:hypothetical protein
VLPRGSDGGTGVGSISRASESDCSIEGCGRPCKSSGLCYRHYELIRLWGSLENVPTDGLEFADDSAKGAWAEALVQANLLGRGYEVFAAVSPSATCDLVTLSPGGLERIEVRCGRRRSPSSGTINIPAAERFDRLAVVMPDGRVFYSPPFPGEPGPEFTSRSTFQLPPEAPEWAESDFYEGQGG